jgi:hypothetical protein|tara:strand:+ start:317 stop:805 length:489 start_codon:yes stop_codon:yes gene_type:complete
MKKYLMISAGDDVFVSTPTDSYYGVLVTVSFDGEKDVVQRLGGDVALVDRKHIYPKSYTESLEVDDVVENLRLGICEVIFEKTDGDIRVMSCTLDSEHIPADRLPKTAKGRSGKTIAVWDVIKEDWRSFSVDRIKKFERLTGIDRGTPSSGKLDELIGEGAE